jgi:phage-related protein
MPNWPNCRRTCGRGWRGFRVDRIRGSAEREGPQVRHIRGQLWEIRLKGKAGIARALYVTAREHRVVILRAFIKKTQKRRREKSTWPWKEPRN